MRSWLVSWVCVAAVLLSTSALAAEQPVLGKSFAVKDPAPGVDPSLRSVSIKGKEPLSDNTVVGDPVASGVTVEVIANGGNSTAQIFALPAGASVDGSPGWKTLGSPVLGYTYKDKLGINGPVKAAVIKRTRSGTFLVNVTARGVLGPGPQPHIMIAPPVPGSDGGVRFTINGGDTYCVAFGAAAGGAVTNKPTAGPANKVFKVVDRALAPTVEAGCPSSLSCFIAMGNGTVRDTCTGLQWELKNGADGIPGAGTVDPSNVHDVDNPYAWAGICDISGELCQPTPAAETACKAQTPPSLWASGGCELCGPADGSCVFDLGSPTPATGLTTIWDWIVELNATGFAGHTDWRIPSAAELAGIIDLTEGVCGGGSGACIDPIFGPTGEGEPLEDYWSADSVVANPWAMFVDFLLNVTFASEKNNGLLVRAVR